MEPTLESLIYIQKRLLLPPLRLQCGGRAVGEHSRLSAFWSSYSEIDVNLRAGRRMLQLFLRKLELGGFLRRIYLVDQSAWVSAFYFGTYSNELSGFIYASSVAIVPVVCRFK